MSLLKLRNLRVASLPPSLSPSIRWKKRKIKENRRLDQYHHLDTPIRPQKIPLDFLALDPREMSPLQLTYTAHTAAKLQVSNFIFWTKIAHAAGALTGSMKPKYFSQLVHAMSLRDYRDEKFVKAALEKMEEAREATKGKDIAVFLRAIAKLGMAPPILPPEPLRSLAEVLPSKFDDGMEARGVLMALCSLSRLGVLPPSFLSAGSEELARRAKHLTTEDLASLLRALAKVKQRGLGVEYTSPNLKPAVHAELAERLRLSDLQTTLLLCRSLTALEWMSPDLEGGFWRHVSVNLYLASLDLVPHLAMALGQARALVRRIPRPPLPGGEAPPPEENFVYQEQGEKICLQLSRYMKNLLPQQAAVALSAVKLFGPSFTLEYDRLSHLSSQIIPGKLRAIPLPQKLSMLRAPESSLTPDCIEKRLNPLVVSWLMTSFKADWHLLPAEELVEIITCLAETKWHEEVRELASWGLLPPSFAGTEEEVRDDEDPRRKLGRVDELRISRALQLGGQPCELHLAASASELSEAILKSGFFDPWVEALAERLGSTEEEKVEPRSLLSLLGFLSELKEEVEEMKRLQVFRDSLWSAVRRTLPQFFGAQVGGLCKLMKVIPPSSSALELEMEILDFLGRTVAPCKAYCRGLQLGVVRRGRLEGEEDERLEAALLSLCERAESSMDSLPSDDLPACLELFVKVGYQPRTSLEEVVSRARRKSKSEGVVDLLNQLTRKLGISLQFENEKAMEEEYYESVENAAGGAK